VILGSKVKVTWALNVGMVSADNLEKTISITKLPIMWVKG
jgi:hypothetical protein